jgi:hypothetical protein
MALAMGTRTSFMRRLSLREAYMLSLSPGAAGCTREERMMTARGSVVRTMAATATTEKS